jgi:hypothetical protein
MKHCRYNVREILQLISQRNNGPTNKAIYETFNEHLPDCLGCKEKLQAIAKMAQENRRVPPAKPNFS